MRSKWFTPYEILVQATSRGGELIALAGPRNPYPGKLGVIEEGASAEIRYFLHLYLSRLVCRFYAPAGEIAFLEFLDADEVVTLSQMVDFLAVIYASSQPNSETVRAS